eukprot:gi/632984690/ref/XP_007909266.1/ PREDICTED: RAS guanyl-releasing protein 4 [Callorhinchus milii]
MNRRESKRKSRQESLLVGKSRQRECRRRMTCPSPAEISKAILSVPQLTKTLSLHELVMKCVHSFDEDGALRCNSQSVDMMLMMHSWIVPSTDFVQKLFQLYQDSSPLRERLCHFIRYWITHYPAVFTMDSDLELVMLRFLEFVRREGTEAHSQLIDTSNIHLQQWTRRLSLLETPNNKKRKVSLLFDHLEPGELAEHLSFLEFKAFSRISYLDYRNYVVCGSVRENPALERSISLVNGVSQWVQLMILNRHTAAQRAEVFTKFIHVAQKLRQLQNFNTLMAVIGGLCHSAISRLKETSSFLAQDVSKPVTPCKPPVLGDWGLDVIRKLDAVTVGKHVQQMVDSVFKNYDHDQDGYISHEEFEKIASIFPFAIPFNPQREGLLSREEITGHLMRGSALCSRPGQRHSFQENTFMRPTFCDMCTGFLWGVTKQGYRCQDCGINCHKQCVEQVTLECKKRTKTPHCESVVSVSNSSTSTGVEDIIRECHRDDVKDRIVLMIGRVAHPISVRVKPPVMHQFTQTETTAQATSPQSAESSPLHTEPHGPNPQPHGTRASQREANNSGCERCSQRWQNLQQEQRLVPGETRLLEEELSSLRAQVRALQAEVQVLRSSQGVPTLTLIVEQMDNLHVQQAPR